MKIGTVFMTGMAIGMLVVLVFATLLPEPVEYEPIEIEQEIDLPSFEEIRPLYVFPIHPDDFREGELTSPYGERDPKEIGGMGDTFHNGIDLYGVSHVGTWQARVVAIADGTVAEHWIYHDVYGKMIVLDHGNGVRSRYAHLSKSFVHERYADGSPWKVEAGEVIGRQGNTGLSKGRLEYASHLHFEMEIDGETVNPLMYLTMPSE
jgi:murein DD-endopeptidase MepM/ murein hydrolase activator NlpD